MLGSDVAVVRLQGTHLLPIERPGEVATVIVDAAGNNDASPALELDTPLQYPRHRWKDHS